MREQAAFRRRVWVLAVVLGVAALLAASEPAHTLVREAFERVRGVIVDYPTAGKVLFVAASALSAMLAFFSSAVVVPVAVYVWGEATTLALLWSGWLVGGCASYLVGRTAGRRLAAWAVSPARLSYYTERITRRAGFFTILLFQLAVPSEIPGYVLGTLRFRFRVYVGALALAELPFAVGAVYLGESFVRGDYVLFAGIGGVGLALVIVAFRHLQRRIARDQSQGSSALGP